MRHIYYLFIIHFHTALLLNWTVSVTGNTLYSILILFFIHEGNRYHIQVMRFSFLPAYLLAFNIYIKHFLKI